MAKQSADLDTLFFALSDPTRRAVVGRLGLGPATVGELAAPFDMALPSFMKHISFLERSELIVSKKSGRTRTCMLNRDRLIAAERWFGEQHALWTNRYSNLDDLLSELNGDKHDN
jgi:DNA-binding transcriptional ArsR family regulator